MPTNTPDQALTIPVGTDTADNPQAFLDFSADVIPRLVLKYTDAANRTATHTAPTENDVTALSTENRVDIYNGANYISLATRANHATMLSTASQNLTLSSTVFQNITGFSFDVEAGRNYIAKGTLIYSSSTVADIKFTVTAPAVTAIRHGGVGLATATAGIEGDMRQSFSNSAGSSNAFGGAGVGVVLSVEYLVHILPSANGTVQFQAAQNAVDATQSVVHSGSFIEVMCIS
jgi:hypothetical protein